LEPRTRLRRILRRLRAPGAIQAKVESGVRVLHAAHAARIDRGRNGLGSSKRQTTMAKMTRERKVKERRELKQEKKQAAAAERNAKAADDTLPEPQPQEE
jgi:hypothetical protein